MTLASVRDYDLAFARQEAARRASVVALRAQARRTQHQAAGTSAHRSWLRVALHGAHAA